MVVHREPIDLAGVVVAVDGEEATTMTTTTTLLHHTTPTIPPIPPTPTTPSLGTELTKAGVLASGLVLQVVQQLDGQQANLPTEETGAIRLVVGVMETAVAVAGTMVEKETQGVRPVIASPVQDMRVLGLAVPRDADQIVVWMEEIVYIG